MPGRITIYLSLLLFICISNLTFSSDTLVFVRSYGMFQNAVSVSTGRGEAVFVADAQANQIIKYSKAGIEVARFGGTGFGANSLNNPVSVDGENGIEVYVCDNLNNRIQKLDYKLNVITAFDFNQYNQTAENSKRVFYPTGVISLSSGDVSVITGSSENKCFVINSFSDITTFVGSNFGFDRIGNPAKIVRGNQLDMWILDKETNEVVNFNSSGLFVRRLKMPTNDKVITIAFCDNILYLLTANCVYSYDLKAAKFSNAFAFGIDEKEKITDFALLNSATFLFLSKNQLNEFSTTK